MGKRPAPLWATLFFGIKESGLCSNKGFLKKFEDNLLFYKRYLDDILAIWLVHSDPATNAKLWQDFKDEINDFHGLEWTFTEQTKAGVVMMNMSLSIERDKIVSTIYEKSWHYICIFHLTLPIHQEFLPASSWATC